MKSIYVLMMVSALGLAACDEGPAENLGERLDDAATDIGNAVEDACEGVRNAVAANDPDC